MVKVTIPPETVQTGGVIVVAGVVKTTGRPEVAVASRATGGTPHFGVSVAGAVTLMVCVAAPSPDTANVPVWASAELVAVMVVLKRPVSVALVGFKVMVAGKLRPLAKGNWLQAVTAPLKP